MRWLVGRMKWVMLVSGLLTMTMVRAAIAPDAALRATFGETLEGPLAEIIVRSWGTLITLVGAMLVYAAFRPAVRGLVLLVAGASKVVFIALILVFGYRFLAAGAWIPVVVDAVMVLLFAAYLLSADRNRSAD